MKLLTCLSELADIPEREKNNLIKLLQITTIRKNEYFIAVGESPDKVAFIVEGLFRIYYLSESGKENSLVFRDSGKFLSAYNYLLENSTSKYTFQALEESVLLYVTLDDYAKLMKSDECWQQVLSKYYQLLFIEKEEKEVQFLSFDAKDRYRCFITKYPELSNRISQYHIASYLGITPEALSRIRKQLIDIGQ
ncbi:MAG: Crp/Fnr family transcriptional regulator [Eubacteriaceae bacterium]|jgi:CRP-like cAMP-binding protein